MAPAQRNTSGESRAGHIQTDLSKTQDVPPSRLRALVDLPARPGRDFVLYWMAASRRTRHNFGLQRAVELAVELDRPLLVFEGLRLGYRWANQRHHAFVLDGMADNARACADAGVRYYPWVEPEIGAGRGLLAALAQHACALVSDDWPCFFVPRAQAALALQCPVRFELVDGNGLLPLALAGEQAFPSAYAFRRALQRELPSQLLHFPRADPLQALAGKAQAQVPAAIEQRWPAASRALLECDAQALAALPLDTSVPAVATPGGTRAAQACLRSFLERRLALYAEQRSSPAVDAASGLSAYLHYGHIGTHQVAAELFAQESWSPARLSGRRDGKREGWWGLSPNAEAFLDELVTWRELGLHFCSRRPDYDQYESLPNWARATLEAGASDAREHCYSLADFEAAHTHDPLWNAAQTQLVREGRIHNYLRMLWGKKVIEWTRTPQEALSILIELNNKYALDGRDPNSYAGIFWCLGRFDRPWAPTRPIFGQLRWMSSANTARKFPLKQYLERYAAAQHSPLFP